MELELNPYKSLFLLVPVSALISLVLLILTPGELIGEKYLGLLLVWVALFVLDVVLVSNMAPDSVETITLEENSSWIPLQALGTPVIMCIFISILFGVVLGGYYVNSVNVEGNAFIPVPVVFSAQPVPFSSFISGSQYDSFMGSYPVGIIEELIWPGSLMPILWFVLFFVFSIFVPDRFVALGMSLIIASLLTGVAVAYIFHTFVYSGNLVAYSDGLVHFSVSSFITGVTGVILGSQIAHIMHNYAAKEKFARGGFQAVPLQAFINQQQGG